MSAPNLVHVDDTNETRVNIVVIFPTKLVEFVVRCEELISVVSAIDDPEEVTRPGFNVELEL